MKGFQGIRSYKDVEALIIKLDNIYTEWLKAFPFELKIFSHLKEEFSKELPILRDSYAAFKNQQELDIVVDFYSEKTFLIFLAQKTTKLLSEINTLELLESGEITDIERHKIDFIINERRLKLQSRSKWSRFKKPDYIDYISEWFADEMQFIDNIEPYFGKYYLNKSTKSKKRPAAKYFALFHKILIELKEVPPFELVNDTELPKKLIEQYSKEHYGFSDGQSFYREFAKINTSTHLDIARSFGKNYKQKVIEISQNCAKVIKHLEKYPN